MKQLLRESHRSNHNTLETEKTEHLSKEMEDIKKNPMETLDQKCDNQNKKFTGRVQQQNGHNRGNNECDSRLLEILQSEQTAQRAGAGWGGQNLRDLKNDNIKSGLRSLGCQKERIKNAVLKEQLIIAETPQILQK